MGENTDVACWQRNIGIDAVTTASLKEIKGHSGEKGGLPQKKKKSC